MSYTGRRNFKTAREKNQIMKKNVIRSIIILAIFLAVYSYMNRVAIMDYIHTYFY